jgi:DNA primase
VMLCLTTTAIDIDEELLNRCLVLTINETSEQTAAIQQRQRLARTLDGLQAKVRSDHIVSAHRAAQTLLRPLAVVNPFAESLTFASDRVRLRRDHVKYLALIDAIALLHQQQRPVRVLEVDGAAVEYIEVTRGDIALANRLAHAVLGRSLDELPPQTRRVLSSLDAWVREQAGASGAARADVRFTRRAVRAALGLSDTQLRVHLDRLVQLEYVRQHTGQNGSLYTYSLLFDGENETSGPQLMGLSDEAGTETIATSRGRAATLRVQSPDLAGTLRPPCGELAGTSRSGESIKKPKKTRLNGHSSASVAKNVRSRPLPATEH